MAGFAFSMIIYWLGLLVFIFLGTAIDKMDKRIEKIEKQIEQFAQTKNGY